MSGITAWATWTSAGVSFGGAPAGPAKGKLAVWPEAPKLSDVHPRARRPHPHSKAAVQLGATLLKGRTFESLGVVVGTSAGCVQPDRDFQHELETKGAGFGSPSLFVYTLPTAPPGELSVALQAKGPLLSLDTGRCSALTALGLAAREVDAGRAEAMLCGAIELGVSDEFLALFLVERGGRSIEGWKSGFGESPAAADGALDVARALAEGAPKALSCVDPNGFWTQVRLA